MRTWTTSLQLLPVAKQLTVAACCCCCCCNCALLMVVPATPLSALPPAVAATAVTAVAVRPFNQPWSCCGRLLLLLLVYLGYDSGCGGGWWSGCMSAGGFCQLMDSGSLLALTYRTYIIHEIAEHAVMLRIKQDARLVLQQCCRTQIWYKVHLACPILLSSRVSDRDYCRTVVQGILAPWAGCSLQYQLTHASLRCSVLTMD